MINREDVANVALIVCGPQRCGKTYQSRWAGEYFGGQVFSTGEIFRETSRKDPDFAAQYGHLLARGVMLPDDVVQEVVARTVAQVPSNQLVIFDGAVRNGPQASQVTKILQGVGRRIVSLIFLLPNHVANDRRLLEIERATTEGRPIREDDQEDYFWRRLGEYRLHEREVAKRLHQLTRSVRISAEGSPETVTERVRLVLECNLPVLSNQRLQGLLHMA